MESLNSIQLENLYSDFCYYRDKNCGGHSDISVKEFYQKNRRVYDNYKINQCDGCLSNIPVVDGLHISESGLPLMTCTARLYR